MSHLFKIALLGFGALASAIPADSEAAVSLHASRPVSLLQRPGDIRPAGGDRAAQQLVTRIRTDVDALRQTLDTDRTRQRRDRQGADDQIQFVLADVAAATDHLSDHLGRRQVAQADVDEVLRHAGRLDEQMATGAYSSRVQNAWNVLQRDLDAMASAYGRTGNWRNSDYASDSGRDDDRRLSGTYELDTARSDNPQRIADQALGRLSSADRSRTAREIEQRLDPPAVIAIDRQGDRITLASSQARRTSFDADGQAVSERGNGDRDMTTRAVVYGDRIDVTTEGFGRDAFSVTFEPLDGGRSLRLTKRLSLDTTRQPVTIRSVYRRISDVPDWNVYAGRRRPRAVGTSGRAVAVPDGTVLTATLDSPINLRTLRTNERVMLTVHGAPENRFENAVLEGYLSSAPDDNNDRSRFDVVFDTLRLTNGRTVAFAGTIDNVRGPNGESISFSGENVDAGDERRDKAIQRGAIGAAVGAIVGAIAGGGKGAAVGAAVGAGGGAATVLINGTRQTELPRGTTFTVRARGDADWN